MENEDLNKDKRILRTLDNTMVDGKRVLLRVDFNVSVGPDNEVGDDEDYRIRSVVPTIEELQQRRCKILVLTHRGRPQEGDENVDIAPVHNRLEQILGEDIKKANSLYGSGVEAILGGLSPGGILMLPNIRFDSREKQGNTRFAEELASTADVFVNEAFSACHRAHTSIAFVPQYLEPCAGRRTALEVEALTSLRDNPVNPYVAIVSGAKISSKVGMLIGLLDKVDKLCIGGQLANVFLAAKGIYDEENFHANDLAAAKSLLQKGEDKLILPVDVVTGEKDGSKRQVVAINNAPREAKNLWDVGPKTVDLFLNACRDAKTVMWNGPIGMFEIEAYAKGTNDFAKGLSELGAYRVIGGGDTVNAIERQGLLSKFDHVSIGGGAMIAFLEGKRLPGLEPLYI